MQPVWLNLKSLETHLHYKVCTISQMKVCLFFKKTESSFISLNSYDSGHSIYLMIKGILKYVLNSNKRLYSDDENKNRA